MTKPDAINPDHYRKHPSGIECIQITEHFNFCMGNAIKYIFRCDHKGGIEDLKKARWYLDREIQRRENGAEPQVFVSPLTGERQTHRKSKP